MDHYLHSPIWIAEDLNLPNIEWEFKYYHTLMMMMLMMMVVVVQKSYKQ